MGAINSAVQRAKLPRHFHGYGVPQVAMCTATTVAAFTAADYFAARNKKHRGKVTHVKSSSNDPLLKRLYASFVNLKPHETTIYTLIAINTALFVLSRSPIARTGLFTNYFQYNPLGPLHASLPSMVLSAFHHGSTAHLAFNMFALAGIGSIVHRDIGRENFLAFYVSAAAWSSLGHYTACVFQGSRMGAIGASGAIYALAGFTAVTHPGLQFLLLFVMPCMAYHGMLGIVAMDVIGLTGIWRRLLGVNLAHSAHLGGCAAGVVGANFMVPSYFKHRTIFDPAVRAYYNRPITALINGIKPK